MHSRTLRILTVLLFSLPLCAAAQKSDDFFAYFGTYTGFRFVSHSHTQGVGESKSKGIYVSRFNSHTGALSEPVLAAEVVNPSYLAISPDHRFLYAESEDPESVGLMLDHASYLTAFRIDHATGKLVRLNRVPSGGTTTCYISLDRTGRFLLAAHYGNGSITVLRIKPDGSLGEETAFVQHLGSIASKIIPPGTHPHSIDVSPDNRHVVVTELGLGKLMVYDFDAKTGELSPVDAAGFQMDTESAPKRFLFNPSGKFGYALEELVGTVDVLSWNAVDGTFMKVQAANVTPAGGDAMPYAGEIEFSPSGKFFYESNRWHRRSAPEWKESTIKVFSVDAQKGTLEQIQEVGTGGLVSRDFTIDPTGHYLLASHQLSDSVTELKIGEDGKLTPTAVHIAVGTPANVQFVPVR